MRLFVAITLPAEVREALAALARSWALEDAKLVPAEQIHATLAFLGEVADDRADGLRAMLTDAVAERAAFAAETARAGAFPSTRRARAVWVGLESPDDALPQLAASVRAACREAGCPAAGEERFAAHLTLARLRTPAPVALNDTEPMIVPVEAVELIRSRLGSGGARHESLGRLLLSGSSGSRGSAGSARS